MDILNEFRIFIKTIFSFFFWLIGLSLFLFLYPFENSFSIQFFRKITSELLPEGVNLIVTNPLSAFVSEIQVSIVLSFIILFPFFLYKTIRYLSPALLQHEKMVILKSVVPSSLLFFVGCIFAYFYVIPATFNILYPHAVLVGATPFFSISEFLSSVLGLTITVGVMFLLPIFMFMLSLLRVVDFNFWKNHFRHALLFFLIFTAIITPDGTGITMLILFIPLTVLYFLGLMLTRRFKNRSIKK